MKVNDFISLYRDNPIVKELVNYLERSSPRISLHLSGLAGSLDALLMATLYKHCHRLQLIILDNPEEALAVYGDCSHLLSDCSILLLPGAVEEDKLPAESLERISNRRAQVIHAIDEDKTVAVVVTHLAALLEKIPDPSLTANFSYQIEVGQPLLRATLEKKLQEQHFTKVDFVYKQGQYAIRGGIIDLYPVREQLPLRIELWGNKVSKIRIFNPKDQLSFKEKKAIILLPTPAIALEEQQVYSSFSACLPKNTCIWIKNKDKAIEQLQKYMPLPVEQYETIESLIASMAPFHQVIFNSSGHGSSASSNRELTLAYDSKEQPNFQQNFDTLADDLFKRNQQHYQLFITALATSQLARIEPVLQSRGLKFNFVPLLLGLRGGFVDHTAKVVCYTDHQFFNRLHRYQVIPSYTPTEALLVEQWKQLQIGDYVVHSDHGIGRFAGLYPLQLNGHKQEAIRLVYKNNDVVYVNVHELYKIHKYSSKEGSIPTIDKLGSTAWKQKKATIKRQIKDIAKELIALYAERKKAEGFAFGKDTLLDLELASSFDYEETPDQTAAITAVKADMERSVPMDRLVCGDVGLGKTEIAIRAAFKAVQHGKQVAVLVPTTILALQHYNSFLYRLAKLPVYVSYINRFKTKQEIQQTFTDTASGKIDILIGTHKLLAHSVKFHHLGLLIIDEEQKFGVSAKEQLRQLRANVDTLTLTATPIPRTLHFSLMGARDLSILTTPPANRCPIQTMRYSFDWSIIKHAIDYEIARKGQLFFVHNKVSTIQRIAQELAHLMPTLRIAVAHGQMAGTTLEKKILQFIAGDYDLLMASSIIESGIDMPNVNTIIINDSHLFGLADLHQMRGRVGRSNVQAFCYLLVPPDAHLTPAAKLRLAAVEEFSALGDGFKLAMRDLDIRGTGDLLGAAQSGFIADIGFETYCKILEEAVEEVKRNDFKALFSDGKRVATPLTDGCSIETDCEALLPLEYVQNSTHRMLLYTRLNEIKNKASLACFRAELVDRFGPLPPAAEALLEAVTLRWEAQRMGFQKIILKKQMLSCYMNADFQKEKSWEALMRYMQDHTAHCHLKKVGQGLSLTISTPIAHIAAAKDLLITISNYKI